MTRLTLHVKHRCSLCEKAFDAVERVRKELPSLMETRIELIDITTDGELLRRYRHDVPVLSVDGVELFKHRVDEEALAAHLRARAG